MTLRNLSLRLATVAALSRRRVTPLQRSGRLPHVPESLARALIFAGLVSLPASAATPPALVNYQGILRDSLEQPQTGSFDMTFRFFDAQSAGNEILVDAHTGGNSNPVVVANGLFTVQLGGGTVSDGSGPGTYLSLSDLFRDYGTVWMETTVGAETLSPRVRVVSSAYALNSESLGGKSATDYLDTSGSSQTKAGSLTCNSGLEGNNSSGFGVQGFGGAAGGFFAAQSGTSYAYVGSANFEHYGIKAVASDSGGFFRDSDGTSQAYVAYGNLGVDASGNFAGGHFSASGASGQAYVGYGDLGINAWGNTAGGFFSNGATLATASLAGGNFGIDADGTYCYPFCGAGGHFTNLPYSGRLFAAIGDTGVYAGGSYQGGEFVCDFTTGHALLASGDFGVIGYGHPASGLNGAGGYFKDISTGSEVYAGQYGYGIFGRGSDTGGYFENSSGLSYASLGSGAIGVSGQGNTMGGRFEHFPEYVYAFLGYYSSGSYYSILGNGIKSFVQNDPFDKDKVVVFAALEGDEAGTYTRGTARLKGGVAHVALEPSFSRVTNPDIGLTAHVTPRARAVPLTVTSVSTSELVVEGSADQDLLFDYAVFGLRLGFEGHAPIQAKVQDSPIPPEPKPEDLAGADLSSTALARFTSMRKENGETSPVDLSRSERLKAAVRQVAPRTPDRIDPRQVSPGPSGPGGSALPPVAEFPRRIPPEPPSSPPPAPVPTLPPGTVPVPLAERVFAGDVLALDPQVSADRLVRSRGSATETVVGVVAGESGIAWSDTAPLALAGSVVRCQVDASYGAVHPGDLLVASPTPGFARREELPAPGTVLGRALESLEAGTGSIRILARPQ